MTRIVFPSVLLVLMGWTAMTSAQQNEPSIYGWGEHLEHIQPLPAEIQAELMRETKRNLSVGFFYRYSYLFSERFKLWTWNGQYVLYEGDDYFVMTDAEFKQMLGKHQFNALGKPLAYRVPFGPILLIIVAVCVYRSKHSRAERFYKEQRYREAMQVCYQSLPGDSQPTAKDFDNAITIGSEFLTIQHGIPSKQAADKLRLVLSESIKAESMELRQQGAACEMDGLWEQAEQFYELAARLREPWDRADAEFLRKCIARVQTKHDRQRGLI